MATIWIGQDYLVKRSVIDSNVEWDKVTPIIDLVQRKHIERLLGTDLYNAMEVHLLANINSGTTIPTNYKNLLDKYILYILTYYLLYEASATFKFRYSNKGVQVKSSDNSQSATNEDIELLESKWKTDAEGFVFEMIRYLELNPTLFPEYSTNITNALWADHSAYDTDIYLGGCPTPNINDYYKRWNGHEWR